MFYKGRDFFTLSSLYSFKQIEFMVAIFITITLSVSIFYILIFRLKNNCALAKTDRLVFQSLIFTIVFFAAPDSMSGGHMLSCRLALIPVMLLLPWISINIINSKLLNMVNIILIPIVALFVFSLSKSYRAYQGQYDDLLEIANKLQPNKTILFVSNTNYGYSEKETLLSQRIAPLMNVEGIVASNSNTLGLSNLMAWTGYSLVGFNKEYAPNSTLHIDEDYYYSGVKDVANYNGNTSGKVDYIIIKKAEVSLISDVEKGHWRPQLRRFTEKDWENTMSTMNNDYELSYSTENGLIDIYINKNSIIN